MNDSNIRNLRVVAYDDLGNEVAGLKNERMSTRPHEMTFDGGKVSTRVYFDRLFAGSNTETKEMVAMK